MSEVKMNTIIELGLGNVAIDRGVYGGIPAVFIEPVQPSGVPGEMGPDLPLDRLQPGTIIIKIHNQRGANVLAENLTPLISNLVKQRDQLCAVAGNPDWILAPDGMPQEQFVAAGGQFADMKGGIHPSIQDNDVTEMWLWVLPNPKVIALKVQVEEVEESSGEMKHHTRVLKKAVDSLLTERDGDIGNIDDTLLEAEMEVQAQEKLEKHVSVGDGKR